MRLRGWTAKRTAERFVLHPNTVRNWQKSIRDKHRAGRVVGAPPWNKLHEAVRWTVHEICRLCLEREFGTRSIARHIVRAGIQISRASVRRILEEDIAKPAPMFESRAPLDREQRTRSSKAPASCASRLAHGHHRISCSVAACPCRRDHGRVQSETRGDARFQALGDDETDRSTARRRD